MADKIEIATGAFAQPESTPLATIIPASIVGCLVIGLILSLSLGSVPLAILLGVALISTVFYWVFREIQARRLIASIEFGKLDWATLSSDIQRQDLAIESAALARLLNVDEDQTGDIKSALVVAEDLALRQIQLDEKTPIIRQVLIGNSSFDGVLMRAGTVNCIEVHFLVTPEVRQEKVDSTLKKCFRVKQFFGRHGFKGNLRLMLVLVSQLSLEDQAKLRDSLLSDRFRKTPVDIDIRLLDFESLQNKFLF